jgi:hypothetical protein
MAVKSRCAPLLKREPDGRGGSGQVGVKGIKTGRAITKRVRRRAPEGEPVLAIPSYRLEDQISIEVLGGALERTETLPSAPKSLVGERCVRFNSSWTQATSRAQFACLVRGPRAGVEHE